MLKFHHIGCLVGNIDESIKHYRVMLGPKSISDKIFISSQKVMVCFVDMGNEGFVELIESMDEGSVVEGLRRKGFNYYHVGYSVSDLDKTIKELESSNFKLIDIFNSEAFDDKRCAFMYTPEMHLIELIEK